MDGQAGMTACRQALDAARPPSRPASGTPAEPFGAKERRWLWQFLRDGPCAETELRAACEECAEQGIHWQTMRAVMADVAELDGGKWQLPAL